MFDDQLIADFVAAFETDQFFDHRNPSPEELNAGIDPQDWNRILWTPKRIETPKSQLRPIYDRFGKPFPPLYERLILTWKWLDVSTKKKVRLFANPPGPTLEPFDRKIFNDTVFHQHLIAAGFVLFGLDINNYDPICFDTNQPLWDGDCMVVKFEHEAMLSFDRIGEPWVLWPSCRAMMIKTCNKKEKLG